MTNSIIKIQDHEANMLMRNKDYDPAADPVVRRSGLGGSEMAVVLGLDTFKSPLQLWNEKRGTWPPENDDVSMKEPVRIGRALEDDICTMFAEDMGFKTQRYRKTPRKESVPWAMAHPDRRVVGGYHGKNAIIEAKWTSRVEHWGEPGTDQIPEYYLPQVHQEMWLTGAEVCLVPVWLFAFRIRREYYVVERDDEWFEILKTAGDAFWKHVTSGIEPPVDFTSKCTQEAIRKIYRYGFSEEAFMKFDARAQNATEALNIHKRRLKEAQQGIDAAQAEIDYLMGDAQFGMLPDGQWWKRRVIKRKGFTVDPTEIYENKLVPKLPDGVLTKCAFEPTISIEDCSPLPDDGLTIVDNRIDGDGLNKYEQSLKTGG